jgi:copper chaperone CopZ
MSWYNGRLREIIKEQKKNLISPFAKDSMQGHNYLENIVIIITNMQSTEDYNKIRSELLALDGVKKVERYLSKKIQVLYDTDIIEAKQILDKLDEMGWQYIKRICRNCGK